MIKGSYPLIWVLMVISGVSWSQNKQLLFGFGDIPQSLMQNPGQRVEFERHFGIPFFSQIHLNGGSSGLSMYDVFANDSQEDINSRIGRLIFELSPDDFFTATQQLEVISVGWRNASDWYLSAGVYQELDAIVYYPKDLAILAWEGNQPYLDRPFDLGQVSALADLSTVYHFGFNKQINKRLIVGGRAKLYSGVMNLRSTRNRGTLTTRLSQDGEQNIYQHELTDVDVTVHTAGITDLDEGSVPAKLLGRAIFSGNMGLGVDLGLTYELTQRIDLAASVIDLGAVRYGRNIETRQARGTYILEGIELLFPPLADGEPAPPYYDDLEDAIEEAIPIDTLTNAYLHWRPVKANLALSYGLGQRTGNSGECDCLNMDGGSGHASMIGFQWFSMARPKRWQHAATLFYYRRIWDTFSLKATFTADSYSNTNLGLGFAGTIGRFQLYALADNVLRYGNLAKAKSVSLQLGFNLKIDQE